MGKKNSFVKQILTALQGVVIKEILGFSIKSALFVLVKSVLIPATALFIYHLKFAPKIQERSVIKFEGVKMTDQDNNAIKAEINDCNTNGIFVGFIGQYRGELKFLNLIGKWDFNITAEEQVMLDTPDIITYHLPATMKDGVTHILNTCNSLMQTMELGSTKDTNPSLYNSVYTEGNIVYNALCSIDDNTKAIFDDIKKNNRYYKIIDTDSDNVRQSNFFNCIKANLNLSQYYSSALNKIYIYPIRVREYDIAFISLSYVSKVNGRCFSEDGKRQEEFASRIAEKLQQNLN